MSISSGNEVVNALAELVRASSPSSRVDIYAIGSGADGTKQLSIEALQAFSASTTVFGFSDVAHLAPLIRLLGSQFVELDYSPIQSRETIFRAAAIRMTQCALRNPPIGWLTWGSPILHVWLTQVLRMWARREGLTFRTVLAPSSLDVMLDALELDDSIGFQLYDAATLTLLQQRPNAAAHCFIFNPQKADTDRSCYGASPRSAMLIPLIKCLLQVYPETHAVSSIVLSIEKGTTITTTTISSLADLGYEDFGTLWIPPVRMANHDTQCLARLHTLHNLVRVASTPCDPIIGAAAQSLAARIRQSLS